MTDNTTQPSRGSRGLAHFPPFTDLNGQRVIVQESSLATEPALRVYIGEGDEAACAHLSLAQAALTGQRLLHLAANHYQFRDA